MATTTLLSLDQSLLEATGDWLQVTVTTAIAASKLIVSTALNQYDQSQNGIFDKRWVYIEDYANAGVSRLLGSTTYATSTGTAYVYHSNLATDTANLATVRISRSSWADRKDALTRAISYLYPNLYKSIDDKTLILGNILPDGHFESWSSATALTHYSTSNATLTKTSTAGLIRGGTYSCKITAGAANGYLYISSDTRPELLDLRNTTISFKCWAYPEVADDFNLVIYTIKPDGTAQTLPSTTTTYAGKYNLVELEDQAINDDIEEIQFRFKVTTNTKYVYVDDAWVNGVSVYDLLLPDALRNGGIDRVKYQVSGEIEDLGTQEYADIYGWDKRDDGVYSWLHLPSAYASKSEKRVHLIGTQPYESLSASSDTISTNNAGEIELIIAYAKYILYQKGKGPVSSMDKESYEREMSNAYGDYIRLLGRHSKPVRSGTIHINPLS